MKNESKKIALWAFQPALRGGFNYTLLELKDSATVLNNSGKVHGVICVVDSGFNNVVFSSLRSFDV